MKRSYHSYLLRLWKTDSAESAGWVASLEDPHSHQVTHFSNLEALFQYLLRSTQAQGAISTTAGKFKKK